MRDKLNQHHVIMAQCNIQDKYQCYQCKSAADIYGRDCKHGMLFPLLLLIGGNETCPNYELDTEKVKQQIESK